MHAVEGSRRGMGKNGQSSVPVIEQQATALLALLKMTNPMPQHREALQIVECAAMFVCARRVHMFGERQRPHASQGTQSLFRSQGNSTAPRRGPEHLVLSLVMLVHVI